MEGIKDELVMLDSCSWMKFLSGALNLYNATLGQAPTFTATVSWYFTKRFWRRVCCGGQAAAGLCFTCSTWLEEDTGGRISANRLLLELLCTTEDFGVEQKMPVPIGIKPIAWAVAEQNVGILTWNLVAWGIAIVRGGREINDRQCKSVGPLTRISQPTTRKGCAQAENFLP